MVEARQSSLEKWRPLCIDGGALAGYFGPANYCKLWRWARTDALPTSSDRVEVYRPGVGWQDVPVEASGSHKFLVVWDGVDRWFTLDDEGPDWRWQPASGGAGEQSSPATDASTTFSESSAAVLDEHHAVLFRSLAERAMDHARHLQDMLVYASCQARACASLSEVLASDSSSSPSARDLSLVRDGFGQASALADGARRAQESFHHRVSMLDELYEKMRAVPGSSLRALKIVQEFSRAAGREASWYQSSWGLVVDRCDQDQRARRRPRAAAAQERAPRWICVTQVLNHSQPPITKEDSMRTIKRYSNRKLYDQAQRHYVTLGQLAAVVRAGDELRVVDHVTGADLTAQTLAQIIYDEEKREPRLGVELLVGVIRRGIAA